MASFKDKTKLAEFLNNQKWPTGLQETLLTDLDHIPIRFFICDDSASMNEKDGHIYNGTEMVTCTRWEELTDTLKFHADMAHEAKAKTQFRFLNRGLPIIIGDENVDEQTNLEQLEAFKRQCKKRAEGKTPLCRHLREVTEEIKRMEPELRRKGQKACVIIATDGTASDKNDNMKDAVDAVVDLPVWMVIRLCTDEKEVVNHWNKLEKDVEIKLDVLDDLAGEGRQVVERNPWLNYGLPLHRIREFGISLPEFDLIDERRLEPEEIFQFCAYLLGTDKSNFEAAKNLEELLAKLHEALSNCGESYTFNTQEKDKEKYPIQPWIDLKKLSKHFLSYYATKIDA